MGAYGNERIRNMNVEAVFTGSTEKSTCLCKVVNRFLNNEMHQFIQQTRQFPYNKSSKNDGLCFPPSLEDFIGNFISWISFCFRGGS